ncbi:MAG: uncharacterized protein A8A55_1009 [Amphiamblys sp. WSBS2006]|nr:MAG: uncharacterized protein A8A55_1009 [Amphiamblys sp. WSBS2006]
MGNKTSAVKQRPPESQRNTHKSGVVLRNHRGELSPRDSSLLALGPDTVSRFQTALLLLPETELFRTGYLASETGSSMQARGTVLPNVFTVPLRETSENLGVWNWNTTSALAPRENTVPAINNLLCGV